MHTPEIISLRLAVEQHIGRSLHTPSDFDFLIQQIWEQQHQVLSQSTIKRLWEYVDSAAQPRLSTLNTLAQFVGYADWNAYLAMLELHNETQSELFHGEGIRVEDLSVGDLIEVQWLPNRQCVFRYLGDNHFVVQHSIHAKLQVGDTFDAIAFIIGKPMYLDHITRPDTTVTTYVAGKKHGITSVKVINC